MVPHSLLTLVRKKETIWGGRFSSWFHLTVVKSLMVCVGLHVWISYNHSYWYWVHEICFEVYLFYQYNILRPQLFSKFISKNIITKMYVSYYYSIFIKNALTQCNCIVQYSCNVIVVIPKRLNVILFKHLTMMCSSLRTYDTF